MGGVQAIVGQHQQLRLQSVAALIGPQRHIALLLVERLQARLGRCVYLRGKVGANAGQFRKGQLHRAGRNHRHSVHRQLISCRDQWCNEQANAQVTCVFFEQLT